ncbi:hypothetical protein KR009_011083, partial [Drosophila setifemur]
VQEEREVQTMVILNSQQNINCSLQDWIQTEIPTLRITDQIRSDYGLRHYFNNIALAIVCIGEEIDTKLIDILAKLFENFRQERIILWIQKSPPKEFFEEISRKVLEFHFANMLILEMGNRSRGIESFHRLSISPSVHFQRLKNISNIKHPFHYSKPRFSGLTARVKLRWDRSISFTSSDLKRTNAMNQFAVEDREIAEFALNNNITLNVINETETDFDIQFNRKLITKNSSTDLLGFVSPLRSISLTVVVPCGHEIRFKDIYKQLNVSTWFLYILLVYVILVLVETVLLVVTHRIFGRAFAM